MTGKVKEQKEETKEESKDDGDKVKAEPKVEHFSETMENKGVPKEDGTRPKTKREEIAEKFAKEQRGYEPEPAEEEKPKKADSDDQAPGEKQNMQSTDDELSDDDKNDDKDDGKEQPSAKEDKSSDNKSSDDDSKSKASENEDEEMETVVINGKRRKVAKSKIESAGGKANYQKIVAASEQFQENAQNKKILEERATELQKMEAELAAREEALSKKGRATPEDELPENGVQLKEIREQAKKYREALFNGDEDAADEALANLVAAKHDASTSNNDNTDDLVETAAERAIQVIENQRYRKELTDAVSEFNTEYEDIATDERLWKMADAESAIVKKEHPSWTPSQILTEAGERIRNWREENMPKTKEDAESDSTKEDDTFEKRRAEKERLSNVKTSAERKPAAKPKSNVMSNADYVTQLRKQRGLE